MDNVIFINKQNYDSKNAVSTHYYSIYEHKLITDEDLIYSRYFIVMKDRLGVIVRFTRLHLYTGVYQNKIYKPITSNAKTKMHYICSMLNYILIDNSKLFRIYNVLQITYHALNQFFQYYALEKTNVNQHKSKQTIEKCVMAVTNFMINLKEKFRSTMLIQNQELYYEKLIYDKYGRSELKKIPNFSVSGIPTVKTIFRDIPSKVFLKLLSLALIHAPDIALAIGLQAFAGLRPGEVCNVRQENSPLGNGILFVKIGARVTKISINLTKEIQLRSDGISCGRIKCERTQNIYPYFIPSFLKLYQMHEKWLKEINFEQEYCPLFINSTGKAMTYRNYCDRFHNLVNNHLVSSLLKDKDPELQLYGQLLLENTLGPHSLRHWFSVQLVLNGEDIAQVQSWRGDTNPQSAFLYLQNKGELIKELEASNNTLFDTISNTIQKDNEL